ncbi:MAG TPA: aldehyde dehydrogenase family protein, partial [Pirellulales bacterium]
FLSKGVLKSFVGGKDADSSKGETFTTLDPGSGEPIATVAALQADDVDKAVKAAQKAFNESGWAKMSPNERGVLLHRLADAVEKRKKIIGQLEALDCGKIQAQAEGDVGMFIATVRYYADLAQHVQTRNALAVANHEAYTLRHPLGVIGFIFPWNFPFLLLGWGIAPALAAGNTVVVKPAEDTPLSTIYLAQLAKEVGIPDGVINVVTGYGAVTGKALSEHKGIKKMSFTGSPEVGSLIAQACAKNLVPVKLELGGKGAAVVFDDVDVNTTADKLAGAITFHTGQVCCDATRWIVQKKIYDKFVDAVKSRLEKVNVGYQMDAKSQMGPVVNAKQRDRVLGYLDKGKKEGAELVLPGGPAKVEGKDGFYVKPALLAGSFNNVAAREEIFGPVAFITPFSTEDEALQLTNDTEYGLANSVWSADLHRAHRFAGGMCAGNSWINAHNVFVHGIPYGGINKSGMGGGVLSPETLFDYWRSLSVVRPL